MLFECWMLLQKKKLKLTNSLEARLLQKICWKLDRKTWAQNKIFLHQPQQPGHIVSLLCGQLIKEQL